MVGANPEDLHQCAALMLLDKLKLNPFRLEGASSLLTHLDAVMIRRVAQHSHSNPSIASRVAEAASVDAVEVTFLCLASSLPSLLYTRQVLYSFPSLRSGIEPPTSVTACSLAASESAAALWEAPASMSSA